jgi:predicted homoserine dehydrogenase-like protein
MEHVSSQRAAGCALVGAGEFGSTFAAQVRHLPGLRLDVVCDRDISRAKTAAQVNRGTEDVVVCESRAAVLGALETGKLAVIADYELLRDLPLAVVVEATGYPHFAASVALLALECGYNLALATKEAESVIGPILARRAKAAGRVVTPVEGDQPSLLMGLIGRARSIGLPVIAAGKSTESDYVYDPAAGTLTAWDRTVRAPEAYPFAAADLLEVLAKRVHPDLETGTPPDLCEMGVVANHTGLMPDRPELHIPVARSTELPSLFRPRSEGGLLGRTGVVDAFMCLRRPDELSFAGGVFVVTEAPDARTGRLLASKGIPASPDGRFILIHNPVHLLGVEAVLSVLAASEGRSTGGETVHPRVDLAIMAKRDLGPGHLLELGPRHMLPLRDAEAHLVPAQPLGPKAPVPYYLAIDSRLTRRVAAGSYVTGADIDVPANALLRLRLEQDAAFFGKGGPA